MAPSLLRSIALKSNQMPEVFNTVSDLREFLNATRAQGKTIGFVPTMGNLHQGHLDLVNKASEMSDVVIVSIFVNPMQFGPHEDFDAYPRTLDSDCSALANHPCNAVFAPTVREMYPKGVNTEIDVANYLATVFKLCVVQYDLKETDFTLDICNAYQWATTCHCSKGRTCFRGEVASYLRSAAKTAVVATGTLKFARMMLSNCENAPTVAVFMYRK